MSEETFKLKCQYCVQGFKNQQTLLVDLKCKHAAISTGLQLPSSTEPFCESDTNKSISVESAEGVIIDEEVQIIEILEPTPTVERRRGCDVRKSITNKFKPKLSQL